MGWDPSARLWVGIAVEIGDLLDSTSEVVNCGHAEATGKRFCPECGKAPRVVTEYQVRKEVEAVLVGDAEDDEGDDDPWLDAIFDSCLPKPYQIVNMAAEGDPRRYILGVLLRRDCVEGEEEDWAPPPIADALAAVGNLRAFARSIGIDRPPQLYVTFSE